MLNCGICGGSHASIMKKNYHKCQQNSIFPEKKLDFVYYSIYCNTTGQESKTYNIGLRIHNKSLDTLGRLSAILLQGRHVCALLFIVLRIIHFSKGLTVIIRDLTNPYFQFRSCMCSCFQKEYAL